MQEEADARLGGDVPDEARQQHQVIVVDPDRVARLEVLEHGVAKAAVRGHVGRPSFRVALEVRGEVVEQRPERLVGIALVETPGEGRGQVHGDVAVLLLPLLEQLLTPGVRIARTVTGPADPQAAALLQYGVDGAGQATGTGLGHPAVGAAANGERQTVRDDDELSLGHRPPPSSAL